MSMIYSIATIPQHLTFNFYESLSLVYPFTLKDTIGDRIYKIRKRRGLLRKDLATLIGVKYSVIWRVESKNDISEKIYNHA
jgi:hypothetical protein